MGGVIALIGLLVVGSVLTSNNEEYDTGEVLSDSTYSGYEPETTYFDEYGYDYNDRSDPPTFEDDPYTTNDETNDQPTGYYGTETVEACNDDTGECYELDADFSGDDIETVYFPKGGHLDFDSEGCDGSTCYGTSEEGEEWYFNRN